MHSSTVVADPTHGARAQAERHWRAGVAHGLAGRWKEAEKAHARATKAAPREALFWVNLGQARRKLGDLDGALDAVEAALRASPGDGLALQLRLAIRLERHQYGEALVDAERVARLPDAGHLQWSDYGSALYQAGRHREAASALLRALACRPDHFAGHVMLCNVFDRLGLHREAVECLRTALAFRPDWSAGQVGVVYHSLYGCDWSRLDADLAALQERLGQPGPHDISPFLFLSAGTDAARQRAVFAEHAALRFGSVPQLPGLTPADLPRGDRLRIGYLSNDFHQHATAMLIAQVLELHDRLRVEVRLYSYGSGDGSPMRRRLESAGDAFVELAGLSDREAAQRIRDDGVEILVDLKGYTLNARTAILAMRPAPIQVAYLGFPGTMGAPFIDYAIADPIVAPASMAEAFTESLAWLPDCYQPNDRLREIGTPPGRAACGLPEHGIVFCCFNHTYKLRAALFDRWCRLLERTPGSVLWLLQSNLQARGNLLREAAARGIDPGRLVFAPVVPPAQNLARLTHADLFLDTLPINAHTTASDALWAGVPVVTCPGDSFVGRVAASLLSAAGLADLIAPDLDAYERLAGDLAADPARLSAIRERLRAARADSPLFDSARITRGLEALYERMRDRWRAGLAPAQLEPRQPEAAASVGAS